jgi:cyclase
MKNQILFFVALMLCCCAYSTPAQTDWSKVEIKVIKVAGNVYMLEGAGGNIGVSVGPDGILIVDDQFARSQTRSRLPLKQSAKAN